MRWYAAQARVEWVASLRATGDPAHHAQAAGLTTDALAGFAALGVPPCAAQTPLPVG
jgi:hypothetical protein